MQDQYRFKIYAKYGTLDICMEGCEANGYDPICIGTFLTGSPNPPTEENDTIFLGLSAKEIDALNGDDNINSGGGNDTIIGGNGDDILEDHFGFDNLTGEAGSDTLISRDGGDILQGGSDEDELDEHETNLFVIYPTHEDDHYFELNPGPGSTPGLGTCTLIRDMREQDTI